MLRHTVDLHQRMLKASEAHGAGTKKKVVKSVKDTHQFHQVTRPHPDKPGAKVDLAVMPHHTYCVAYYKPAYKRIDTPDATGFPSTIPGGASSFHRDPQDGWEYHIHRDPHFFLCSLQLELGCGSATARTDPNVEIEFFYENIETHKRVLLQRFTNNILSRFRFHIARNRKIGQLESAYETLLLPLDILFLTQGGGFPLSALYTHERLVLRVRPRWYTATDFNGRYSLHLTGKTPLSKPYDWNAVALQPSITEREWAAILPKKPFQWNTINSTEIVIDKAIAGGRRVLHIPLHALKGLHVIEFAFSIAANTSDNTSTSMEALFNIQLADGTKMFADDISTKTQMVTGDDLDDSSYLTAGVGGMRTIGSARTSVNYLAYSLGNVSRARAGIAHGGLIFTGDETLWLYPNPTTDTFHASYHIIIGVVYWMQARFDAYNRFQRSHPYDVDSHPYPRANKFLL